jgi:hypothetical protein
VRRAVSLLLLSFVTVAGLAVSAPQALAGPGESEFVSRTNAARTSRGLKAYAVRSDLVAAARRHAARMAARGDIYHNPNLGSEVGGWRSLGENVGVGGDVESIHNAFMNSSGHRANILDRTFTEVGIGTATSADGRLYVTEIFRLPSGTTAAPAPAPAPKPAVSTRPRPATAPRPAITRRPAVAVDPAAALRSRFLAARAAARRDATGVLDRAVSYHGVMSTLGG